MIHDFLEGSLLLHIFIFTEKEKKKFKENDAVTFVGIHAQKKKTSFLTSGEPDQSARASVQHCSPLLYFTLKIIQTQLLQRFLEQLPETS